MGEADNWAGNGASIPGPVSRSSFRSRKTTLPPSTAGHDCGLDPRHCMIESVEGVEH